MCFFRIFKNIPNSVFPRCQCVYTHQAGRKPAPQQNWESSQKSPNFKEKTQYIMNTLYVIHTKQKNYIFSINSAYLVIWIFEKKSVCLIKKIVSFRDYVGWVWYTRNFFVPPSWTEKEVFVRYFLSTSFLICQLIFILHLIYAVKKRLYFLTDTSHLQDRTAAN